MKYISFLVRVTFVVLALSYCFSLTQAAFPKCTKKDDCSKLCNFPGGNCYGGLCKCYDAEGNGVPPKDTCKEEKKGECKKACLGSKSKVVKNTNGYKCDGSKFCFCKFEFTGVLTKCVVGEEEDESPCKPKDDKPMSKFCKSDVTCDGVDSCTCDDATGFPKNNVCEDDTYCEGVCNFSETGGKLCSAKDNKKVCVCTGKPKKG